MWLLIWFVACRRYSKYSKSIHVWTKLLPNQIWCDVFKQQHKTSFGAWVTISDTKPPLEWVGGDCILHLFLVALAALCLHLGLIHSFIPSLTQSELSTRHWAHIRSDNLQFPYTSKSRVICRLLRDPGISRDPVFFQNPDPWILKNLIPGFFGISRSP